MTRRLLQYTCMYWYEWTHTLIEVQDAAVQQRACHVCHARASLRVGVPHRVEQLRETGWHTAQRWPSTGTHRLRDVARIRQVRIRISTHVAEPHCDSNRVHIPSAPVIGCLATEATTVLRCPRRPQCRCCRRTLSSFTTFATVAFAAVAACTRRAGAAVPLVILAA